MLSYINKVLAEPQLKTALQKEMEPLLANSNYDPENANNLALAVSESAQKAIVTIMCKGFNRLTDEQIKSFLVT